jgi:hypothetical protein
MVAAIEGKEAEALEGVRKARVVHPPLKSDAGLYPLYIVAVEKIAPYLASSKESPSGCSSSWECLARIHGIRGAKEEVGSSLE